MNQSTIKAILEADCNPYGIGSNLLIPAIADQLKVLGIKYTFEEEDFGGISLKIDHSFVTKITMMGCRIDLHHKDDCDAPEFFIDDRQWKAKLKRWLTEDFNGLFF